MSADGRMQVSGDVGLKGSQTYPELFGWAVAHVLSRHHAEMVASAIESLEAEADMPEITLHELLGGEDDDQWDDAELGGTFSLLMQLAR